MVACFKEKKALKGILQQIFFLRYIIVTLILAAWATDRCLVVPTGPRIPDVHPCRSQDTISKMLREPHWLSGQFLVLCEVPNHLAVLFTAILLFVFYCKSNQRLLHGIFYMRELGIASCNLPY